MSSRSTSRRSRGSFRKKDQGIDMARPDDRDVAPVDGGDLGEFESLAQRDDGGVCRAEAKVSIPGHELTGAAIVLHLEVDGRERAVGQRLEELGLRSWPAVAASR
jgi:hypothetical protein